MRIYQFIDVKSKLIDFTNFIDYEIVLNLGCKNVDDIKQVRLAFQFCWNRTENEKFI